MAHPEGEGVIDPDEAARRVRCWYVLHVKPRTEKRVESYLVKYGCFHYLPLRAKTVKVQRRRRTTYLPLFPGYVFTRLNADERLLILRTNLMVRMISVEHPRQMIHQLRQVNRALRAKPDLVASHAFAVGEHVRIINGPFRGLDGVVRRTTKTLSVVLNVEMIGSSIELTISPSDLEAPKEKQTPSVA